MKDWIIYSCPFVPAEWIAAHGMRPSRIMPNSKHASDSICAAPGVCPYVRAFAGAVASEPDAAGVVVTTMCDQMRRASELIARDSESPVFLMNVPSTWETVNAQKMYGSELQRLGRFLVQLGGESPSTERLAGVMREYDAKRSAVRDARGSLSARSYSDLIARFHRDGDTDIPKEVMIPQGVPLALVGGPLLAEYFQFFDLIEGAGGYIALDATETGERTLPAPFDRRRMSDEPLEVLAEAYFGSIPDASRRPNSLLYQWLKKEIDVRGIRGIIFVRYVWCDMWHAEAQRMKEWLGLPFFDLDISEDLSDLSRKMTRFEAFMEMLR